MKKILYTVCSANHLAHCKTMLDSFVQYNEGFQIVIGLVDKINGRFGLADFTPHEIIEVDTMGIPNFGDMSLRYTVIELNCAMKPFVAQYLFSKHIPDILVYLDSDIWVRNSFKPIEEALQENDILLTPHFNTPYPDATLLPHERDLLRSGVYNAGFMALRNTDTTRDFLKWWASHMQTECYYNFAEGMGVDQIWLNLAPVLFARTGIFTHPGANVAYWNLHERKLSLQENTITVNEVWPLLFLHISGYRFSEPAILSRHQNRFQLSELPVITSLLTAYRETVIQNGYEKFNQLTCAFSRPVKKSTGLMKTVNGWLKPFGIRIADL